MKIWTETLVHANYEALRKATVAVHRTWIRFMRPFANKNEDKKKNHDRFLLNIDESKPLFREARNSGKFSWLLRKISGLNCSR